MKSWVIAILFAPFFLAIPTQAQTPEVWTVFKQNGSTITEVDGKYNIAFDQDFTAEVYFRSTSAWQGAGLCFGWGSATESYQTTNDNSNFTVSATTTYFDTADLYSKFYGGPIGFVQEGSSPRPFGDVWMLAQDSKVEAGVAFKGMTYTIHNNMAIGSTPGEIVMFSNLADSMQFQTYIDSAPISTVTYKLTSVPEPSSLMAMGCAGVGVLGNLLHRRRKKTAAKS